MFCLLPPPASPNCKTFEKHGLERLILEKEAAILLAVQQWVGFGWFVFTNMLCKGHGTNNSYMLHFQHSFQSVYFLPEAKGVFFLWFRFF